MKYSGKKFAIVSQSLPPEKSGQAILLGRLLQDVPQDRYCLISNNRFSVDVSGESLPAVHHDVGDSFRMKLFKIPFLSPLLIFFTAFLEMHRRKRVIADILKSEGCDVAVGCSGDLINLPATWLACRKLNIPFVAYIMDDFIYQWTGLRRILAQRFERKFIRDAKEVLVLNEFVVSDYRERYGIRPTLLRNPVDVAVYSTASEIGESIGDRFKIVYTGSIYHAHFDAFAALFATIDRFFPGRISIEVYSPQDAEWLSSRGIKGEALSLYPPVPSASVPAILAGADTLFLPLAFNSEIPEVLRSSAPFKMSEYLATGKPIFVLAPQGSFLSWFFETNDCGFVCTSKDEQVIKQALETLLTDKDERARVGVASRAIAEKLFDIQVGRETFLSCFDAVTGLSAS